jgi:hypothetical protein
MLSGAGDGTDGKELGLYRTVNLVKFLIWMIDAGLVFGGGVSERKKLVVS